MITILRYQDDGPRGICGQAMSITSNWDKLMVCTPRKARKISEQIERGEWKGRKNPRITGCWEFEPRYFFGNHYDDVMDKSGLLRRLFRFLYRKGVKI